MVLYSTNLEASDNTGFSVGFLTLAVPELYSAGESVAEKLGTWLDHNLSSTEDDEYWERKVVNGHILTVGERGSRIFEQLADKPIMAGVANIPCSRLYIRTAGDSMEANEPAKMRALAVVNMRIEQSIKLGS
jgi:hypothetical protein